MSRVFCMKTQRYSVCHHTRQRKAQNLHNGEAGTWKSFFGTVASKIREIMNKWSEQRISFLSVHLSIDRLVYLASFRQRKCIRRRRKTKISQFLAKQCINLGDAFQDKTDHPGLQQQNMYSNLL